MYFQKVGKNKEYLENLIFSVSILLRAFNRYYPYIQHNPIDSGDFLENVQAKSLLDEMSRLIEPIKDISFDDS